MSMVALTIDALLPALGLITQDLAIQDANQTQFVISVLFLGMAIGQLVCGPLSDALGRKPVLYGSLGVYLIGSCIGFVADDLASLLAGRFIQGLGVAGPYISAISLVRDQYKGRGMARIMSLVLMIFVLVPAIAPALGQAVLFITSWHGIFILYLVYALIVLLWIFLRLTETLPADHRIPFTSKGLIAGFKEVLSNRFTTCLIICIGFSSGSFIGYLTSSQQIIQVQFDTGRMFSVYFGILALVLGVASSLNSRFVVRLGMYYISSRAFTVNVAASLVFIAVQWVVVDVELWMFMFYVGILFFCFGLLFGNLNAMAMEPMGHVAGIAAAIIGSVSSIMSISIGTTIGQLYNGTVMPITCGFLITSGLALTLLRRSQRYKEVETQTPD